MFDTTTTPDSGDCDGLGNARSASSNASATSLQRLKTIGQRAITALGICALGTLAVLFFRPDLADDLKAASPFASASQANANDADPLADYLPGEQPPPGALDGATASVAPTAPAGAKPAVAAATAGTPAKVDQREQKWVTNWLSRRYRVATDATHMLVTSAYKTARDIKLDPLLILAVMAIESGLNPFAESPVGAQGLMQVMAKVHHDKFEHLGGVKEAFNPTANIKVGSMILKDYVQRTGSVEGGLKMYVGAGAADSDDGYGSKVLAEYHRLKEVAAGKRVPIVTAVKPVIKPVVRAPQTTEVRATTPENHKEATQVDALQSSERPVAAPASDAA